MKGEAESKILSLLNNRAPNFVPESTILRRVPGYPAEEMRDALRGLAERDIIETRDDPHPATGSPEIYYRPKRLDGIPIRTTIRIGDTDIPRLLSDSKPSLFPETLNEQVEALAEYAANLEKRFADLVRQELKEYWATMVGILGVVVAILALVIAGLPKIQTDPTLPFFRVVLLNLAQLLPLAIVLALLVLTLHWVVRK
jgi:hypothetical protein